MKTLLCAFAILMLFLGGCTPQKDPHVESDPLEQAHRSIDREEYDSAISQLEDLASRDTRPAVTQALASAYAGRAGLRIENYWNFLSEFQAPSLSAAEVESTSVVIQFRKVLNLDGKLEITSENKSLVNLARMFAQFELWRGRIDRLPTVAENRRADLEKALNVLSRDREPGGRLYRALLGLVAIKSDMQVGFTGWSKVEAKLKELDLGAKLTSSYNRKVLCSVDIKSFSNWVTGVIRRLSATAEDITIAYPSKRPELQPAIVESQRAAVELQKNGERQCR